MAQSNLSFITSRGEEIVLDNYYAEKTIWELYGRTGFEAPPVEFVDQQYADGYTETIAIRLPSRDVAINMVVRGNTTYARDKVLRGILNRIIEHGAQTNWGKLKVLKSDGTYVYLNCHYSGGAAEISEEGAEYHLLTMNFHAADPFFYDVDNTEFYFSDTEQDGLYLGEEQYLGDNVYLSGGIMSSETIVKNTGQTTYPVITVTGPAKNISFHNSLTGLTLEFDTGYTLTAGEVLTIDCRDRKRSIKFTDTEGVTTDITNILKAGSSLAFPIVYGDNNITITYTDTTEDTSVDFSFQKRYLSA